MHVFPRDARPYEDLCVHLFGGAAWNQGVRHCYEAACEVRDHLLHRLYVFGKFNPPIKPFDDAPLAPSVFDLTWHRQGYVIIVDTCIKETALRDRVFPLEQANGGISLRNKDENSWGSLCRYDVVSLPIYDMQWQHLLAAADTLGNTPWCIKPPR